MDYETQKKLAKQFYKEFKFFLKNNEQFIFSENNDIMLLFQTLHKTLLSEQDKGI